MQLSGVNGRGKSSTGEARTAHLQSVIPRYADLVRDLQFGGLGFERHRWLVNVVMRGEYKLLATDRLGNQTSSSFLSTR